MGHILPFVSVLGFCALLSFLFSGMEAGVLALSRLRVRQQARSGKHRARVLFAFLENPEDFLWTILIGNALVNFTAFCLIFGGLYWGLAWRSYWFIPAFLLVLFLFAAVCDLLPKMLFRQFPNRLSLAMVIPFRFIHLALSPVVGLVNWFSNTLLRWTGGKALTGHVFGNRSEFRFVMQESSPQLTSDEKAMINRVLDLQHLTVRSITTPLARVTTVTRQTSARELLEIFREQHLTRLPVWDAQAPNRRIVGLVHLDTLLYTGELQVQAERTAADYVKPALYLSEEVRLDEALRRLQRGGQRMAIVLGLDRRELGIVTLQDILKTIFGEVKL